MRSLLCALMAVVSVLPSFAQRGADTTPPDILQVYRDTVRPGKIAEYTKVEGEAAQACSRANTWPYFTVQAVTGPQEVWFVSGFESYAAMESSAEPFARNVGLAAEMGRIADAKANLITDPNTLFFRYRDELGRNNGLVRPGARFYTVTWYTINPGHEREFEESQRLIRGVRERAGAVDNRVVYQATSGMPGNVYLSFSPYHTFAEAAESLERLLDYDDLDENIRGRLRELFSSSVASSVSYVFSISPPLSNPAGEWIANDPEFWRTSPPLQRPRAKETQPK